MSSAIRKKYEQYLYQLVLRDQRIENIEQITDLDASDLLQIGK